MSNTFVVPAQFLDSVVDFVALSGQLTKVAFEEVGVYRAVTKKASSIWPAVLDKMLKTQVVEQTQKQAAEAMLSSHETTLKLLDAAVEKIATLKVALAEATRVKKAGDLGSGEDDPSAVTTSDSLTNPMVGAHYPYVKASDLPLLKAAGIVKG